MLDPAADVAVGSGLFEFNSQPFANQAVQKVGQSDVAVFSQIDGDDFDRQRMAAEAVDDADGGFPFEVTAACGRCAKL